MKNREIVINSHSISWSNFKFPPINLWSLPKQYSDYRDSIISTKTCKPFLKEENNVSN